MRAIGAIDPGKSGGIVVLLDNSHMDLISEMPKTYQEVKFILESSKNDVHWLIERAQAFPGQGRSAAFNYGHHCGVLEGILTALGRSYETVPAATWMRAQHRRLRGAPPPAKGKGKQTKATSLALCRQLYPNAPIIPPGCKVPHDGIVDALLLADWGMLRYRHASQPVA